MMGTSSEGLRATPGRRVLFLDLAAVDERQNVVHRVMEATKHPSNPVLPLGDVHEWDAMQARPWEARTVLHDDEEGLFKCWYAGTDLSTDRWWAVGYATSEDGVHWEKPRLGLYEYNGNRDNNICLQPGGSLSSVVIKDRDETDSAKRYKMIIKGPAGGQARAIRVGYSPDGIHWQEGAQLDIPEWNGGAPDIVVLLRDEQDPDPRRRYKIVWQTSHPANKPGPEMVRTKCLGSGPDVEHFTSSPANPLLHPNDGLEQENHFLMLAPYGGFYVMLYEYGWYMPNETGNFGSYCADIRLAVSSDGERYERIQSHQPVIARGPRGAWDDGFLVIADKPVIKDDTIYLYYAGQGEDWTGWPGGNTPADYRFASTGCVRLSRMGLATLTRDRFTALETTDRETPGFATTSPITVGEQEVQLAANVSEVQPRRSWIAVEVLDAASGEPLPGFGREACSPLDQEGLARTVRWQDQGFAAVGTSPVKLRCWFYGAARLHALAFEPATG
ncbi:MAG: hypothetical protein CL878_02280 [Dehalococcoidia bacterium]|nr:hypothetical protein [Dehalococcoidia bacterium]